MAKERQFWFGNKKNSLSVLFNHNALKRLQEEIRKPIGQFFNELMAPNPDGSKSINVSVVDLQYLLWAGMEGARLRMRATRPSRPTDINDVGEILDDVYENYGGAVVDSVTGDSVPIGLIILETFIESMNRTAQSRDEALAAEEAKAVEESKAEAEPNPISPETGVA